MKFYYRAERGKKEGISSSERAMGAKRHSLAFYAILPFLLQVIAWPFAHLIFRINGEFVVHGKEYLKDLKGPIIIASNHANELDPVVQRAILPPFSRFAPLFWTARTRKFYDETNTDFRKGWRDWLYGDWFFRSWGAYPAYKGHQDYKESLKHHIKIVQDGYSMGFFPQGTRAKDVADKDRKNLESHGGVAFLAQHTGAPIVPVAIVGTRGTDAFRLFIKKSRIDVYVLPPVYINEQVVEYKEEAEKIMKNIYEAYS